MAPATGPAAVRPAGGPLRPVWILPRRGASPRHPWPTILNSAEKILEAGNVPRPRWTAEQLLAHRLNCRPIDLYLEPSSVIAGSEIPHLSWLRLEEAAPFLSSRSLRVRRRRTKQSHDGFGTGSAVAFLSDVAARTSGVPLQYLLGSAEFYGRGFEVGPGVFIPRPETEVLIDVVLPFALSPSSPLRAGLSKGERRSCFDRACPRLDRGLSTNGAPVVVDVGTGSGAIAVTLALECPGIRPIAIDRSNHALMFAQRNAEKHKVSVSLLQGDLATGLAPESADLIAANLPYLDSAKSSEWPRELHWEPWLALDGGERGLSLVERLIAQAASALRPEGTLILEIGDGQAQKVGASALAHGFKIEQVVRDLAGLERVVILERSSSKN